MKKSFLLAAIGLVLIGAQFTSANDSLGVRLLGRMYVGGAISSSFATAGPYLYGASSFYGLVVIDYQHPDAPRWVGNAAGSGIAKIVLKGQYAYCSNGDWIQVFDISDPAIPQKVNTITIQCRGLAVSENRLYASGSWDIVVYDLTHPEAPDSIGAIWYGDQIRGIRYMDNERVIIQGDSVLTIMDVSDPFRRVVLGRVQEPDVRSFAVLGDRLLVLTQDLCLYDISDPANIALLSVLELDRDWDVNELITEGRYAYILNGEADDAIVELTDPDEMEIVGTIPWVGPRGDPRGCVQDGRLYLQPGGFGSGLAAVDVRNPRNPEVLSRYFDPVSAEVIGTYAYLCTNREYIHIADISEPTTPRIVGYVNFPSISNLVSAGGRHFGISNYRTLHEFDFTEPLNPREKWHSSLSFDVQGMLLRDDRLYLSGRTFAICELDDSAHVRVIGECRLPNVYSKVTTLGSYAFVSRSRGDILVIDIADESHPVLAGNISGDWLTGIITTGDYLYVSSDIGIDVINNSSQVVAHVRMSNPQFPESLSGDYLFVGSSYNRINAIDVSDPANPQVAGYYEGGGGGSAVADEAGIVYTWGNGLSIYDCSEALGIAPKGDYPVPTLLSLSPAYPNPFNSSTSVTFQTGSPGWYALEVVDIRGRLVERLGEGYHSPGSYRAVWNAQNRVSGTYIFRLSTPRGNDTTPVTLVR